VAVNTNNWWTSCD